MRSMALSSRIRIGIDTGGTFTDFIIISSSGEVFAWKIPTTPQDPSEGINAGLEQILNLFEVKKQNIDLMIHGTTIGTNAFLEDKCPPISLITTKGFKDIVEIGRQQRSELYNLKFKQEYPLNFSRDIILEIEERIGSNGEILKPLEKDCFESIEKILKTKDISVIAISLLFSFLNNENEKNIVDYLKKCGFNTFPSYEVCPQIREYERTVTTIVNAKVSPVVSTYLAKLQTKLHKSCINSPLLIMQSNTGVSDVKSIKRNGIDTLYSGLAGGVLAATESIEHLERKNLVSLDIGGTSTDVAAIMEKPVILREKKFAGFPLVANMADIETIGSGGGSIAKFKDGLLTVGPESQGSNPGPACYSLGGNEVTLTDANLYLGYLNKDNFAGNLDISVEKSIQCLKKLLNEIKKSKIRLKIDSLEDLAISVRKILNHNIAQAIRVVTIQKGLDVRDFGLLAFGGAGPIQAWDIAQELEMNTVIIPPFPGTWSAFGLVAGNIKHEKTQSYLKIIKLLNCIDLNEKISAEMTKLEMILLNEGIEKEKQQFNVFLDLRYLGQSNFLTLKTSYPVSKLELEELEERFHSFHYQNYSWYDKELEIELVNISIEGIGLIPKVMLRELEKGDAKPPNCSYDGKRNVYFDNEWIETDIYKKSNLLYGNILEGPCIINQSDSTIAIPPDAIGRINKFGYVIMEKRT